MVLVSCPECGQEISEYAETCPNCAYPIAESEESLNEVESESEDGSKTSGCLAWWSKWLGILVVVAIIFGIYSKKDTDEEPSQE